MSVCPTVGTPGPSRIKRGCCKCDTYAFATAPFPWQQSGRSRNPAILRSDVLPVRLAYSSVSTERLRAAILTSTGRHHNAYTVSEVLRRICGCAAKSIRMAARSLRCRKMKNCVVSEWQRLTKPPRCATIFQRSSGVCASISPTSCPTFSGGCPAARRHHSLCSAGEAMAKARQASGRSKRASASPVGICKSSFILCSFLGIIVPQRVPDGGVFAPKDSRGGYVPQIVLAYCLCAITGKIPRKAHRRPDPESARWRGIRPLATAVI